MKTKNLGKSTVSYDPDTGEFRWVYCHRKPFLTDCIATRLTSNGYHYIKAGGKMHSASRLAIELCTGKPVPADMVVDHINRNTIDNRICNLRVVTQKINLERVERALGQSGVRGIKIYNRPSGNGHMWRAIIGGRIKYFQTLEEAIAGYAKLASEACDKQETT